MKMRFSEKEYIPAKRLTNQPNLILIQMFTAHGFAPVAHSTVTHLT